MKSPARRKVLYANSTAEHGGAEEVLVHYMLTARDQLGIDPMLLVPCRGWITDRCSENGIPFLVISSLPRGPVASAAYSLLSWIPNSLKVARIISEHNIDFVHSNTPRVAYYCGLGARLCRIKHVVHIHDIDGLPFRSKAKAVLLNRLSDQFVAVSKATAKSAEHLAPILGGKTEVVYNGWDFNCYKDISPASLRSEFHLPPDSILIGTAARMAPWKGQDVLIDAYSLLLKDRPHCRLIIAGSSLDVAIQRNYELSLRRRVEELQLKDRVFFTGWRDDCLNYIAAFDIFAHLPVRPDPLPTALIHAGALGRPAVASALGGIPEIIADGTTGLLVPESDPSAACDALKRLVDSEPLRKQLGAEAKIRSEKLFGPAGFTDALKRVYDNLPATG